MTIVFTLYAGYCMLSLIGTHISRKFIQPMQPTKLTTILGINQSILWTSLYVYTLIFNLVVLTPRLDSQLGVDGLTVTDLLIVLMFITLVNTNVRIHGRHLIPYGSNHERIAALAISGGYIGVTLFSMYLYFITPLL